MIAWTPHEELWPDGLVWDCEHEYLLAPIDE
jgi:hypothetical protein